MFGNTNHGVTEFTRLFKYDLYIRNILIHVMCLVEQKVDEQNSMDTSQNDNDAEHSLTNSSEVAEVLQTCTFCVCYFQQDFQQYF